MNVVQPVQSDFLPGEIQNVQGLIAKYDQVVEALAAWPHSAEAAAWMRIDGENCQYTSLQLSGAKKVDTANDAAARGSAHALALAALLFAGTQTKAFELRYANDHHRPQIDERLAQPVTLSTCALSSEVESSSCSGGNKRCVSRWTCPNGVSVTLRAKDAEGWTGDPPNELRLPLTGIDVDIERSGGIRRTCSTEFESYTHLREVRTRDLNIDGEPDLVIDTESGGNGLAADIHTLVFALSTPRSCTMRALESWAPRVGDFVRFKGAGAETTQLVHTYFAEGHPKNYWVYSIVGFRGPELILENSLDSRFPIWIRYTKRPNSNPAEVPHEIQKTILDLSGAPRLIRRGPEPASR